jgi:HSP20 family protein
MSLITWNNTQDSSPRFPSLLDEFFGGDFQKHLFHGYNLPATNIKEEEGYYEVSLAVPGIQKEQCTIHIHDDTLTISAERTQEELHREKKKYSRCEYNYSAFSRSFSLPDNIDRENIRASYENGELIIRIPKTKTGLSTRREIPIQ